MTDWPVSRSSSLSSESDFSSASSDSDVSSNLSQRHSNGKDSRKAASAPELGRSAFHTIRGVPFSSPREVPQTQKSIGGLATPPLTPGSSVDSVGSSASLAPRVKTHDEEASDFLVRLFPGSARVALPYAKSVRISSSQLAPAAHAAGDAFAFEGVVLELPGKPRTLYIDGKGAENIKLRER